jgi:L-alanine-DL-glutamate epimerase-like enolase superfamily enzyme
MSGKRVWELANIAIVAEVETSFTISLDTPDAMKAAARTNASAPILKLKLGGDNLDLQRVEAVRAAAPNARLLIDANESWSVERYEEIMPALKKMGIELIEQSVSSRCRQSPRKPITQFGLRDESCRQ